MLTLCKLFVNFTFYSVQLFIRFITSCTIKQLSQSNVHKTEALQSTRLDVLYIVIQYVLELVSTRCFLLENAHLSKLKLFMGRGWFLMNFVTQK